MCKLIIFILLLVIQLAWSQGDTGWATTYYSNKNKKSQTYTVNGKKFGESKFWYENGQLARTVSYNKEGRMHGHKLEYYKDGSKKSQAYYSNGKLHGTQTFWYDTGQINIQANYVLGIKHGFYKRFYKNGNKKEEVTYNRGRKYGAHYKWFINGDVKSKT